MCIVIVKFNTIYSSAVIDGRIPFIETGNSAIYLIPEDSATLFAVMAKNMPNVDRAVVYRHYKTFK